MTRPRYRGESRADRWIVAAFALLAALVVGELWARRESVAWPPQAEHSSLLGWTSREYAQLPVVPVPPPAAGKARLLVLGDSYLSERYASAGQDQRFPTLWRARFGPGLEVRILASSGWGPDQQYLAYLEKGRGYRAQRVLLCLCINNDLLNLVSNRQGRYASKPYFRLSHWPGELRPGELRLKEMQTGQPGGALEGSGDLTVELFRADGQPLAWDPRALPGTARLRPASALVEALQRVRARRPAPLAVDARYRQWNGFERSWEAVLADPAGRTDRLPQAGPDIANAYLLEDFDWTQYQWTLLEALLAEFQRVVVEDGARLTCLFLPMALTQFDGQWVTGSGARKSIETPLGPVTLDMNAPARRVAALCARQGIEFLDPSADFAALAARPENHGLLWPAGSNLHWSGAAHGWLAQRLEDWVLSGGWGGE